MMLELLLMVLQSTTIDEDTSVADARLCLLMSMMIGLFIGLVMMMMVKVNFHSLIKLIRTG